MLIVSCWRRSLISSRRAVSRALSDLSLSIFLLSSLNLSIPNCFTNLSYASISNLRLCEISFNSCSCTWSCSIVSLSLYIRNNKNNNNNNNLINCLYFIWKVGVVNSETQERCVNINYTNDAYRAANIKTQCCAYWEKMFEKITKQDKLTIVSPQ